MKNAHNLVTVTWFTFERLSAGDYHVRDYSRNFYLSDASDFMDLMEFVNNLRKTSRVPSVVVSDGVRSYCI